MCANADKSKGYWHHPRAIRGYEIRVGGHLDENARDWLGEVSIANLANGEVALTGAIPDQAALLGILLRLNDRGITILAAKAIYSRR